MCAGLVGHEARHKRGLALVSPRSVLIAAASLLSVVSLALTFVTSAAGYTEIFLMVTALSTLSLGLIGVAWRKRGSWGVILLPIMLSFYAMADVALRSCCGVRVMDVFHL